MSFVALVPALASAAFLTPSVEPKILSATLTRRAVAALPGLASAFAAQRANAADLTPYKDADYGISFGIPTGWNPNAQELTGGRKLVIAADPKDSDFNVFVAFTPCVFTLEPRGLALRA